MVLLLEGWFSRTLSKYSKYRPRGQQNTIEKEKISDGGGGGGEGELEYKTDGEVPMTV